MLRILRYRIRNDTHCQPKRRGVSSVPLFRFDTKISDRQQ